MGSAAVRWLWRKFWRRSHRTSSSISQSRPRKRAQGSAVVAIRVLNHFALSLPSPFASGTIGSWRTRWHPTTGLHPTAMGRVPPLATVAARAHPQVRWMLYLSDFTSLVGPCLPSFWLRNARKTISTHRLPPPPLFSSFSANGGRRCLC